MIPVQTINPNIEPIEDKAPSINNIIENEKEKLDDITSDYRWNSVSDITFPDTEPAHPIRSIITSANAWSMDMESNLVGLANTTSTYAKQKILISKLEEEAAREVSGYEGDKKEKQAKVNAGGWKLVNDFAEIHKIFEARDFEGDFNRISQPGLSIYYPEKINLGEEDSKYLTEETTEIKSIAEKYGLNTRTIDDLDSLYMLLNPGNNPWIGGVYIGNRILLNNIKELGDPESRMTASHEIFHALFGIVPVREHTEGLATFLSFIKHPDAVNINENKSATLVPAISERLRDIPLSSEECIAAMADVIPSLADFNKGDFDYVYGYNFAMSFFEYFATEGPEYALDKYMQFYGKLKQDNITSTSRIDPSNPEKGASLVLGGNKLSGTSDAEITQEALISMGMDPAKFKESLGITMREVNALPKQKELAAKMQHYLAK